MDLRNETRRLVLLAIVAFGVFANALTGDFVYDDRRQIVANPLIQDPKLFGTALTSDVWAFKGDGTIPASNYWRPTFTAWCILAFWLFGLDPFGWHLLNVLLHVGVVLLAYVFLRRSKLSEIPSAAIAAIFAVHPVHTESVAWISGAPDVLMAFFLLLSFWLFERSSEGRQILFGALAAAAYALALGAKETALVCFPIFWILEARRKEAVHPWTRAITAAAALFFLVRWYLLGAVFRPGVAGTSLVNAVLSIPNGFVFYIRQIVLPAWLGPNYSLRPVESAASIDFVLPLIIVIGVTGALFYLARQSMLGKLGLLIFLLPLLPAFNITAFPPEQIVHDRYLYLPLLGFLVMVIPPAYDRIVRRWPARASLIAFVSLSAVCVPLAVQTFLYNRVWAEDLTLWQRGVDVDPGSAFNWQQLAGELGLRRDAAGALAAYERSLSIARTPNALLGRAQNLIRLKRYDEAITDLEQVINTPAEDVDAYTLYNAYEAYAFALQLTGRLEQAKGLLEDSRRRLPIYRASLTEKLAVILYLQGNKAEALRELEGVRRQAAIELLPASKTVFFRLGLLYAENGNTAEARSAFQTFLEATAGSTDPETIAQRRQAISFAGTR